MGRPKLQESEVEEQLMEATAPLIEAIITKDIRHAKKALKAIRFAILVNRGEAMDRRVDDAGYQGHNRRLAAVIIGLSILFCGQSQAADGLASYYTTASAQSEGTSGFFTASGLPYNEKALTCALPRRDWGGFYKVTGLLPTYAQKGKRFVQVGHWHNPKNFVVVRHTDFGPGRGPRSKGVVVDLTPSAYKEICGSLKSGLCRVIVEEIK